MMDLASTHNLDNNLQWLLFSNQRTIYSHPYLLKAVSIKNSYSPRSSSRIRVTSSQHTTGNTHMCQTPTTNPLPLCFCDSGEKYAVVSVSNKKDLPVLGHGLQKLGYVIISSGGTASALESAGVQITKVECLSGFPSMIDGRVKAQKHHPEALYKFGIGKIDVVVANLLPETVISAEENDFKDQINDVHICGATIRAAAKNYEDVLVVVGPEDYRTLLEFLKRNQDNKQFRRYLASKAFQHILAFGCMLKEWVRKQRSEDEFPSTLTRSKNRHWKAASYVDNGLDEVESGGIATAMQHHGKEMSYDNHIDADAAWNCVSEFGNPTCVIVKHGDPCGVASRDDILEAYRLAVKGDPVSALGGVLAINVEVDKSLAREIRDFRSPTDGHTRMFYEIVVAPKYSEEGLEILRKISNNLRIIEARQNKIGAGWLTPKDIPFSVVSENAPGESELRDMEFAWLCIQHVKSNAIAIAKNHCLLGVGSGQANHRECLRMAFRKAGDGIKGAAMASDCFTFGLTWKDAVDEACQSGICVIAEPDQGCFGDEDAINCCNKYGVSLLCTKFWHFKH